MVRAKPPHSLTLILSSPSPRYGERTFDQPALPAMVRRGSEIWLYVQEGGLGSPYPYPTPTPTPNHRYVQEEVPGVTIDRYTPWVQHP